MHKQQKIYSFVIHLNQSRCTSGCIKDGRSSLLCNNNFRLRSRFFFHTLFFVVPDGSDDVILVYGCKAMYFLYEKYQKM